MKMRLLPLFMISVLAPVALSHASEEEVAKVVEKTGMFAAVKGGMSGVRDGIVNSVSSVKNGVTGGFSHVRSRGFGGCAQDCYGQCVHNLSNMRNNWAGTAFGALLGWEGSEWVMDHVKYFRDKDKEKIREIAKVVSTILGSAYGAAYVGTAKGKILLALLALGMTGANHHDDFEDIFICCQ